MGWIQTRYTNLVPPHVCGRTWRGCWLGVKTCLLQLIALIYLKFFRFFVQAFFCCLLNFVYHIYWISVHWSWNLSSFELANCQWDVSKPYIWICFSCRFVEILARVLVFVVSPVGIITLIGFKAVPQVNCNCLQVKLLRVFLLIFVKCIFRSGRGIEL